MKFIFKTVILKLILHYREVLMVEYLFADPKSGWFFFKDYYFSEHNQGNLNSFEEAPFAYFSQINNWFEALPIAFNTQILYKIKGTEKGNKIENAEKKDSEIFQKVLLQKNRELLLSHERIQEIC